MNLTFRQQDLNEYLKLEFGVNGPESNVSANWPFELKFETKVGSGQNTEYIFSFTSNGRKFIARHGRILDFSSAEDFDVNDAEHQKLGKSWIGAKDPVDLNTTVLGQNVPYPKDRRIAITELASAYGESGNFEIIEGLYFKKTQEYPALLRFDDGGYCVVGDSLHIPRFKTRKKSKVAIISAAVGRALSLSPPDA